MYHSESRRKALSRGIMSMWWTWVMSVGSIMLLIIIAPFVKYSIVALIAATLGVWLAALDSRNRASSNILCYHLPYVVRISLFISAAVFAICAALVWREGASEFTGQPVNLDNPQIPALVTSPILALLCFYFARRGHRSRYCRNCNLMNANAHDHDLMGDIYHRESAMQMRLLGWINFGLSVIGWGYYLCFYINVNLNSRDNYFFIVLPLLVYIVSIIYLFTRYYTMLLYYCKNEGMSRLVTRNGTMVSYLIIHKDKILIRLPRHQDSVQAKSDEEEPRRLDIPVKFFLPYRRFLPNHEALQMLRTASGIAEPDMKLLYETNNADLYCSAFHYSVWVESDEDAEKLAEKLHSAWLTLYEVKELSEKGLMDIDLMASIKRLYIITMAFKTYDRNGHRLYDIKNYRPTFRFHDLRNSKIDFNDSTWLYVAAVNQDRPFFRIQRWWDRLVNGHITPNAS